ncbi:hypothetical protein VPH35_065806 [Triticum aestivum]
MTGGPGPHLSFSGGANYERGGKGWQIIKFAITLGSEWSVVINPSPSSASSFPLSKDCAAAKPNPSLRPPSNPHRLQRGGMSRRWSRTIYVGNLPGDIREREVEDLFYKYGRIVDIDLKVPPRPPGYAFVEFEDPRDAEDACAGRDGYNFDGNRLRVEPAHGGRGSGGPSHDRSSSFGGGGGGGGGGGRRGVSRHTDYRVLVTGLPSSASWQDLKDHMRRAGDVCFAEVYHEGGGTLGIVDYTNYDDMKYAIKKLDDTEFKNAFSKGYIRVKEYDGKCGRSYSRSRSPSRSRSKSRSPSKSPRARSASRSRSRSRSSRSCSASKGRSPSRSPARSKSPIASWQVQRQA